MLIQVLDILRIVGVLSAVFFGYMISFKNGYQPESQLHFMIPVIIFAVAGISGIEGLFLGRSAAKAKGFQSDGNYQRQTAF